MASSGEEGILTEDNVLPQDPAEVAEQIAGSDKLPTETAAASLREDQITNAINFLSHPKVRGSSKESKVSFLEKKGLTSAEIDEAFKRAPEAMAGSSSTALGPSQARQPLPKPFPTPTQSQVQTLYPGNSLQQAQQPQTLRWTQIVIGASVVAVGVYAVKQMVSPYATKLYRRLYGLPDPAIKAKEEEKHMAEVVASAIQSQTQELRLAIDSLKEMMTQFDASRISEADVSSAAGTGVTGEELRRELETFAANLEAQKTQPSAADEGVERELREIKALIAHQPPSKALKEVQGGRVSPQQAHQGSNGFVNMAPPAARVVQKQKSPQRETTTPQPSGSSPSYMEVLEMLEKGETPPNVRTDIDDKPPNPSQPPPSTNMQPKAKPWDRSRATDESNGYHRGSPKPIITDITDQPGSSKADAWKPPPIPQASLRKSLPPSSVSSTVGDDDEA